jgi:hypothetical protein
MYKLLKTQEGEIGTVFRIPDAAAIPFVLDNRDYQKYLEWLAEGNEPQPADTEE